MNLPYVYSFLFVEGNIYLVVRVPVYIQPIKRTYSKFRSPRTLPISSTQAKKARLVVRGLHSNLNSMMANNRLNLLAGSPDVNVCIYTGVQMPFF